MFEHYLKRIARLSNKDRILHERILPLFLFIITGGFGWAIRGTGGWGGTAGAMLAGLWLSMLFIYLGMRRGIDFRRQAVLIGFGIGFGGMNGYGQMISWIRGQFSISGWNNYISIDPAIGYFNLFLVGVIWGGYAGIGLLWSMNTPKPTKIWVIRLILIISCYYLGFYIVAFNPNIFYPIYSEELYNYDICIQCIRTAETANSMGGLMGAFIGGFIPELFRKNKKEIGYSLIIIAAYAIGFPLGSLWFHMSNYTDFEWSWWKQWEITVGCFGGLGIAIIYFIFLDNIIKGNKLKNSEEKGITQNNQSGSPNVARNDEQNSILKSNRRLFQAGFIILCIYTLMGASKALIVYFGLQSFENLDSESFPPERIIIVIFGLIILIAGQMIARKNRMALSGGDEGKKFQVPSLYTKMHLVNFMIASAGVIAIGDGKMTFVYYLFYALITLSLIFSFEFESKSDLNN